MVAMISQKTTFEDCVRILSTGPVFDDSLS